MIFVFNSTKVRLMNVTWTIGIPDSLIRKVWVMFIFNNNLARSVVWVSIIIVRVRVTNNSWWLLCWIQTSTNLSRTKSRIIHAWSFMLSWRLTLSCIKPTKHTLCMRICMFLIHVTLIFFLLISFPFLDSFLMFKHIVYLLNLSLFSIWTFSHLSR